jgi:hypothetical protein
MECDNGPLVPVTVTLNDPDSAVSVHERVEVPKVLVLLRAIPVMLSVHASPTVGDTDSLRVTFPVNP